MFGKLSDFLNHDYSSIPTLLDGDGSPLLNLTQQKQQSLYPFLHMCVHRIKLESGVRASNISSVLCGLVHKQHCPLVTLATT